MPRANATHYLDLEAAITYANAHYQATYRTTRTLLQTPSLEGQQWSLVLSRQAETTPGISLITFYAMISKTREGYKLDIAE